ncbi:MAG: GWxTD domain-containing protein [Ignavibacteriaceae bacterium]
MKIILFSILSLVLSIQVFCQPKREQFQQHLLLSEIYIIPSSLSLGEQDSTDLLYYIYKLPYNRLVFEKNDNHYTASYRLTVEVHDSLTNTINRKIKEDKISVDDFEKTDDDNAYAEGVFNFQILKNQKYNLIPVLYDAYSDREIKLSAIPIIPGKEKKNELHGFLEPLVVNSTSQEASNGSSFELAGYDGCIPFSKSEYDLIIPNRDTSLKKIFVTLISDKDTVFSNMIDKPVKLHNFIEESKEKVILDNNSSVNLYNNFFIHFINRNLPEGELTINIALDKNSKPAAIFHKNVFWFHKPFSLMNPELAVKLLKYMEDDSVIDSLLDFKKDEYSKILFNYWKRFDPTPETAYNELMKEYYTRIDYSMKNFSSISGRKGIDTDRGKIFILYGKPSETERSSNQLGKVVETWVYKNPYRKFIFVDETGTGEYKLKNS